MAAGLVLWMGTLLRVCQATVYTNEWAVKIGGDSESVNRLAAKHGFTNLGQVGDLRSYYSFLHRGTTNRSTAANEEMTAAVAKETEVEWLQQQRVQIRTKRSAGHRHVSSLTRRRPVARPGRAPLPLRDPAWTGRGRHGDPSDGRRSGMKVAAAWRRGYTGKGVVVSVLDDGIEREHPDLKPNYSDQTPSLRLIRQVDGGMMLFVMGVDPSASCDVNGRDRDPSPDYSNDAANFHGTQSAGMVAAAANNSLCSVGVSFSARIGGIRMLDGDVTDVVEARALSFRPQHIDIYLAGWGPEDDGATLGGPGPLTHLVLQNGVETGRRGRGSVFIWGSGSGGHRGDHCSCDGYANSIFTVSISGATASGTPPGHLERCAATLAAAFVPAAASDGEGAEEIVTLGPGRSCGRARPGTLSSSAAAGVVALTLEANPSLTWRDVQHVIVWTSRPHHLVAPDWRTNGAGLRVSHLYGFGLLDADAMVREAERWRPVPSQHQCVEQVAVQHSRIIRPGPALTSVHVSTGCSGDAPRRVVYLEHVVARVSVSHGRRGDLSFTLTSPSGTESQLLENRPLDGSSEGFQDWGFMTAHCWGEPAAGEWTLTIQDTPSQKRDGGQPGTLLEWSLVMYGTAEPPPPHRDHRLRARSVELPPDLAEEYSGPCDPECGDEGCEGPGPQQCVTCSHFFLKLKNNTRLCVSECPRGFWGDRRRCKRCYSSCGSCSGSRSDQCTSCQPGHHLTQGANTCTPACGDGFYLDHDADTCRKCSEACLKCTTLNICTECKPQTSLRGNRCLRSCEAGSYHDAEDGSCKPCHEACASCAGAGVGSCKRCADGYLTEDWRCVSSCSAGFYAGEQSAETADGMRMCRRCDASCLTCVGPSRRNCSSCSSGHRLQDGRCVASTACSDGEFQGGDGKCHSCDATCLKCTGPQSRDCIGCVSLRALDEGRCVAACAEGKYESGGRCHLCDHTCATCVEGGAANCTSCVTDKFGVERYLHAGRCLDACPEAFYHTAERRCEACSDHCLLCSGATHCLRCDSLHYVSAGRCAKLECGEGEVEDPEYDDCMACQEGCRKCVLYNPRQCPSCLDGFYNFQDGCYRYCPAKTFPIDGEMTCAPCDDNCMSCDEHECYWCETDLFLLEGRCVSRCPGGFFADEDSNNCEECHPDCHTCRGPEGGDCLSCDDGKTLESGACVSDHEACHLGTFRGGDGRCEDCHPSCQFCSGEQRNQCTQCAEGRFLTAGQTCVSKCPGGFFPDRPSRACGACPAACLQCEDAERCVRCLSSRRAPPPLLQDGQCVQECVRGYPAGQVCQSCAPGCASCENNATYCLACDPPLLLLDHRCVGACPPPYSAGDGACRRCPAACRECDLSGACTGCQEFHFLHAGVCLTDCPDGFWVDEERGVCSPCHPDCSLCDGPNADDCDACVDPEAAPHDGACAAACGAQAYRDAVTGDCRDCHASCLSCSGPGADACIGCRGDQRPDASGRCTPSATRCPSHLYADRDGRCHACHKYCQRCSGPWKNQCLSCGAGHFLFNGSCVDACPVGYYDDGQRCEACHASCQSCFGKQSHECLACRPHLFREAKECVESCQHSHYGNGASRTCERCDPSCGECIGGGEDDCLSCAAGLLFLRREGRCLPSCPGGHYHDAAHRTCEPCHAICRTCSGGAPHMCDSCFPGFQPLDGRCAPLCGVRQFPAAEGSGHSCEDCDGSCLECRGSGPNNCTMCPAQAILEAGGRCLLCCRQHEEEEEEEGDQMKEQQDCCNCTETRGECILSSNLPFRIQEEEEDRGNLVIFIIACVLLAFGLVAVVFLVRHSRSKSRQSDLPPRGYEKLGSGGGRHGGHASSAPYGGRAGSSFQEDQPVDLERRRHLDEDEDDEDIVYMGQDGTVYRKFRFGQPGDDNEDELEYDDESYAFR